MLFVKFIYISAKNIYKNISCIFWQFYVRRAVSMCSKFQQWNILNCTDAQSEADIINNL